jgi:hypothetical protein
MAATSPRNPPRPNDFLDHAPRERSHVARLTEDAREQLALVRTLVEEAERSNGPLAAAMATQASDELDALATKLARAAAELRARSSH